MCPVSGLECSTEGPDKDPHRSTCNLRKPSFLWGGPGLVEIRAMLLFLSMSLLSLSSCSLLIILTSCNILLVTLLVAPSGRRPPGPAAPLHHPISQCTPNSLLKEAPIVDNVSFRIAGVLNLWASKVPPSTPMTQRQESIRLSKGLSGPQLGMGLV